MRIGIDVDGVLFDFVSAFRAEAETLFQKDFPTFSSDWDFSNWGLSKEQYALVWNRVKNTHNWFLFNENPFPGVVNRINDLSEHELYFITTRCCTSGDPVLRQTQIQIQSLGIEFPTVLVRKDKGPAIRGLELDVYIDDYFENLNRAQECSPQTKLYLVNQSYNQNLTVSDLWTRVGSFKAFVEEIKNAPVAE